ncbi:helix-turn-helix domain-containing protein [Pseudoclavibacter sp. RFBA6]|uniref:helix-turn-helix domain-containing protein n=1 Tax=Pseudoclavibacter sp. RFBA6 TaxID=2080573 RepID=UPI000CE84371|nr:helix-turn-helix domain-containing protein [Pseudoclavibacter sp. RFBA6]PPG42044.1 DNA-binding protein [Pseudoclavibacter sp. RFBA6]
MVSSSALFHPIRLRIVQSLLAGDELTPHELHGRLSDVPIATLYRHIKHLLEHELIEVADERRARGASERSYRVSASLANPSSDELRSLSSEELMTVFTVFVSGVIRDFDTYVEGEARDLIDDRVSFAQADFWATDEEVDAFFASVMEALGKVLANQPGEGRRRRALTTITLPRPEIDGV